MKISLCLTSLFLVITCRVFAQDCWSPAIPKEKPCYIYFLGMGYGADLEIAKKNASLDAIKQAGEYLKVQFSSETESKLNVLRDNKNIAEENTIREVIKITGVSSFERFARIDVCEKSFRKNNRVYLLYRLPKGKNCPDSPDTKEWKPMKMGISTLFPGAGQWKKKEYFKAGIFPTVFLVGISSSLYFNNQSNKYFNQAYTEQSTNQTNQNLLLGYSNDAAKNRNTALIATGLVYLVNIIDAKFVNTPRVYAFQNRVDIKPYYATIHSGLTFSITLNK